MCVITEIKRRIGIVSPSKQLIDAYALAQSKPVPEMSFGELMERAAEIAYRNFWTIYDDEEE